MNESIKSLESRKDLIDLKKKLGVNDDWHEPDNQGVSVKVIGKEFDNAGFWGSQQLIANDQNEKNLEIFVQILKNDVVVAEVNLATLFSYASEEYDDRAIRKTKMNVLRQVSLEFDKLVDVMTDKIIVDQDCENE